MNLRMQNIQKLQPLKRRSDYWQIIRGISIIAVVLIHCTSFLAYPIVSFDGGYYYIFRNIINFPVALFFFMAGKFSKAGGGGKKLPVESKKAVDPVYRFFNVVYNGAAVGRLGIYRI